MRNKLSGISWEKYKLGIRSLAGSIRSFVRPLDDKDRNGDFLPFNYFAIHLLNSFPLNLLGCKRDRAKATALTRFVGMLESDLCRSWFVRREEFFQLLKGILV
jgi:hypothetical protein